MHLQNYLYFLIITYLGIKFLYSKGIGVKNPLNREQRMLLSGPEMFWVLTFSTGLLAFSAPGLIDLMAIRLLVLEVLCLIGLSITKNRPVWSLPIILYVVYIIWIIVGCVYSPAPLYGFRVVLKYLYPLFIALFASAIVRDTEAFLKAGLGARIVAVVSAAVSFIPFAGLLVPGVFWYESARAINYLSICIFSLALFYYTNERRKNLIYTVLFMLPCFIWVLRTSIMGTLVAIMGFYFIKYRMRSLPIIGGVLVCGILAVFFIPSLNEKMFFDKNVSLEQFQDGKVTMEKVHTNARSAMWKHLDNRFYKSNEIAGSGTGAVQSYMYSNYLFGGLRVPHSDFVQMRCDNGLIGLGLYCIIVLGVFLHCFTTFRDTDSISIKICAITAGASMIGVFATLYSDNVVNYSMATLSMPFGFYGMMLGLLQKEN